MRKIAIAAVILVILVGIIVLALLNLRHTTPPQFVVLSFDDCRSLEMWDETILFAEDMATKGVNIKFTYFISGVYFLDVKNRYIYHPPNNPSGESLTRFGDNTEDIVQRIQKVNSALKAGHEIGSHANGHFNGMDWTVEDWKQEQKRKQL